MAQPTIAETGPALHDQSTYETILAIHAERERNHQFFEAHREELFAEHAEDWLLIHSGGQVAASDNLFQLADLRETLDTVQRAGARIAARPQQPTDAESSSRTTFDSAPAVTVSRSSGPLDERTRACLDERRRNREFFEAHREELLTKYPGMWLLIHSGGQVVASDDLFQLNDLRETLDELPRNAALLEVEVPWPMIVTPFIVR